MRSVGFCLKAVLVLIIPVVFLLPFHRSSSISKDDSTLLQHRSPIDATTLSINLTKSIALPFGKPHHRPNFSLPYPHVKRDDDEQAELKAFCKGVLLYGKIQAAFNGFPSRAPIFGKADIKNGWSVDDNPDEPGLDGDWLEAYKSIAGGQTPEGKGARNVLLLQNQPFINKLGRPITETSDRAWYYLNYFADPPSIYALNVYSPAYDVRRKFPALDDDRVQELVPPLNRFSDMIWTVWANGVGKADPGALRYIGHDSVNNPLSKLIMARVLNQRRGAALAPWPGETFSMEGLEGLALLGTPNGGGVGYVLLDRAEVLGKRRKELEVRIWTAREDYFMLWDLGEREGGGGKLEVIGDGSILPLE